MAVLQHPLQAAAELRGLDLLGVTRTDRAQGVGKHHPSLQQVQMTVGLHLVPVEVLPVQPGQQHVPVPERALVGHVVDRKQRGNPLVAREAAVFDVQIRRHQPGLPVVGVDHVQVQLQQPHGLQHRPREEHKPLAVVRIVLAVLAIELGPVVIGLLVDQVDRHVAAGQVAPQQSPGDRLAARGHDELDAQRIDGQSAVAGLAVAGHDHGRPVAQAGELDRERPADVGQPARLGERHRLTGGHKDLHASTLRSVSPDRVSAPTRAICQISLSDYQKSPPRETALAPCARAGIGPCRDRAVGCRYRRIIRYSRAHTGSRWDCPSGNSIGILQQNRTVAQNEGPGEACRPRGEVASAPPESPGAGRRCPAHSGGWRPKSRIVKRLEKG